MANEPKPKDSSIVAPTLTRSALERVLARAAELQGASGDTDEFGAMTEAQLVDLGKEVGLSADVLRQAMAEERSRAIVPEDRSMLGAFTGVATVTAARTVRGTPAQVLASLDDFMQHTESLQIKRRFADQLVWEGRSDVGARIRRAFTGRTFHFTPANDLTGIVAPVGGDKVHVRLVADFAQTRQRWMEVTVGAAVAMCVVGVPLRIIGFALPVAVIPPVLLAIAAFALTRRSYRAMIARAQVALEQALDRLEFGDNKPPSAAQALLDAFVGNPRSPRR